jgi:hypothetical protein
LFNDVEVISDWIYFREYVERWRYLLEAAYKIEEKMNGEVRVRIRAGRYGIDLSLRRDDPTLEEIKEFLSEIKAARITKEIPSEAFFSSS